MSVKICGLVLMKTLKHPKIELDFINKTKEKKNQIKCEKEHSVQTTHILKFKWVQIAYSVL